MTATELAKRFNDAIERRDEAELGRLIAEDAVWDLSRSRGPYRGVYRGHDEIRGLLESQMEAWERVKVERLSTYEAGHLFAEEVRSTLTGGGSGVELVAQGARVYESHDGRITRFVMFQDIEAAREFVDEQAEGGARD